MDEQTLVEGQWDFRTVSQAIFFLEEEKPSNMTTIHGAYYNLRQAEQVQAELESRSFQTLMNDKNFDSVEEAQAYLLDRDDDYSLQYSRFRILDFATAIAAYGAEEIMAYLQPTIPIYEEEEISFDE